MHPRAPAILTACAWLLAAALPAQAAAGGKLLLTGGVSSIDGAAGGGLTPWALTASYATDGEVGGTVFVSGLRTRDYAAGFVGAAIGIGERAEVAIARQDLDTRTNLAPLGLSGLHLKQDILSAKLRLAGDAVLDSDRWLPQIAIGLQHKRSDAGALGPMLYGPLGARRAGTDLYLSVTKLLLAQGLLLNGTLRWTRANQNGLLGFGAAQGEGYRLQPELSLAKLLSRQLAVGAEVRRKAANLRRSVLGEGALAEDDWFDVFIAWAPNKSVSLTLAWVDLGRIAPALQPRRQRGGYLSAQFAF